MNNSYSPGKNFIGGYTDHDGTIEFYSRIKSILLSTHTVVDIGAGRGAWQFDECLARRHARDIKGQVHQFIGVDVDPVVLSNGMTHYNIVYDGISIPLPSQSVDCIISDYVLEHLESPLTFAAEVQRLLRPGGYFCARTPHLLHHAVLASRFFNLFNVSDIVFGAQPEREPKDVFPAYYRMNTIRSVRSAFADFANYSYVYRCDPAYFFGSEFIYKILQNSFHFAPSVLTGNLFVFLQKAANK